MDDVKNLILGMVLAILCVGNAFGSDKYAIGTQLGVLGAGLSGKMKINDNLTGQVVLSSLGTLTNLSGRGLFKFKEQKEFNLFGAGEVGMWANSDKAGMSLGASLGVETNWQNFVDDIFPLWWSAEIGVGLTPGHTYTPVRSQIGIHYRFD
ncbi:MAG: hypothetical protein OEX19_08215 [Gammaproteobacteria bacterium]|nr:hypothetical protein [Gammaproteobacteria bacterium]